MGKSDKNKTDKASEKGADSTPNPLVVNDIKGNEIDFQAFFLKFEKRFDVIEAKIDSVTENLSKTLSEKIDSSIEALKEDIDNRFEHVYSTIDSFKVEMDKRVVHHADEIFNLTSRASALESKLIAAEARILRTDIELNITKQRERNYSIKCYNLPCDGSDTNAVATEVYENLLEPAFKAAVSDKKLNAIPSMFEVVDAAHKLPLSTAAAAKGNLIPPIQFRFRSRFLRDTFFAYSKAVLSKENAKPNRVAHPIRVAKDLTPKNREIMVDLYNDSEVEKQWLAGTNIRFVLKKDLNKVCTVVNPYGKNKSELVEPVI